MKTVTVPYGFTVSSYEELISTNTTALQLATEESLSHHWIWTRRQTQGRGRNSRIWHGACGNLYASLLLRLECDAGTASQLSLLAGISAFDVLSAALSGLEARLMLKWPNDLLLDHAKIGGILLESQKPKNDQRLAVVIGTGLNLAGHPELPDRKTTSLAAHGLVVPVEHIFVDLCRVTAYWLEIWNQGQGFSHIRSAWLERAQSLGSSMQVHHCGKKEQGYFGGLESNGALIFETCMGERHVIQAGDVFFQEEFKENT